MILRIWDAPVSDDQSTLIFELEDGTMWQLADVGLGWTRFAAPGPDWRENSALKPYLPARTNPRPGAPGSWQYELGLARGSSILVALSMKRAKAFVWRLRAGER